jgi:hypothetical protein
MSRKVARLLGCALVAVLSSSLVSPCAALTSDEKCNFLTADVVALGTIASSTPVWNVSQVTMVVEECVKGACPDTLAFGAWVRSLSGARYSEGERVIVRLVYRGVGSTRGPLAHSEDDKTEVSPDGTVKRMGIPVDEYLSEVRRLLAPRRPERLFSEAELVVLADVIDVTDVAQGAPRAFTLCT